MNTTQSGYPPSQSACRQNKRNNLRGDKPTLTYGELSLYVKEQIGAPTVPAKMNTKYIALTLLVAFLAPAFTAEPACPQLECPPPNSNVACFIGNQNCQCRCVGDRDPCASLLHRHCRRGHALSCKRNGYECTCRCVPK
ncbi:hypothetical protein V5799_010789 [Amblyomma americanum]|uniref:Uncharacterized protein n=1 Tax=Amblyomma americanum TaxID=6943 RepID=A0AAQ4EIU4_AMBAM